MQITLLDESGARGALRQVLRGELAAREVAAELLRHEAAARRRGPRHLLIARVCRISAPAVALDPDLVDEVCDELERQGDIVLADGGHIYPAPVRIVALGDGVFRFVCTVPSSVLFAVVAGEWARRGVRRDCRPSRSVELAAEALRGVVVTPEEWTGLDRVPSADDDWLRSLNARLAWAPEPAGSLERDESLNWTGLSVEADELRWRSSGPACLWKARHRWKRWVYAWSAGESPRTQPFVTLYPDESSRTVYAVARAANKPFRGSIQKSDSEVTIGISGWLPQSEYRHLSTCADPVEASGKGSLWTTPVARAENVIHTLKSRLGVSFDLV